MRCGKWVRNRNRFDSSTGDRIDLSNANLRLHLDRDNLSAGLANATEDRFVVRPAIGDQLVATTERALRGESGGPVAASIAGQTIPIFKVHDEKAILTDSLLH